ncbi:MAG: outer membrane protein assembly factor [Gammaproteobacteria bacterium]|nr:MAG: outer membrane protein assembly factor [Gammaproteobacteria bacterium]
MGHTDSGAALMGEASCPRPPRRSRILTALVTLALAFASLSADASIRVQLTGVEGETAANVRAWLDLVRFAEREDLSETAVRRLYDRAPRQIREALRPFGYYDARVVSRSLTREGNDWIARFEIIRGEPVRLNSVRLEVIGEGHDHPGFQTLLAETPLVAGAQLRHPDFDQLRARLERAASTYGFFDRSFPERRLEIDPAALSANAVLVMDTGPRYRFGEVVIDQDILNQALIERMVFTREGEPFDTERLLRTQYALTDSQYFANVVVETGERNPLTRSIPVNIETVPSRRQRIRLGIGYGSDTRARGSIGWDWRRINQRGHRANMQLQVSQPLTELTTQYIVPFGDPLRERLSFRSSLAAEDLADVRSQRATIGVNHRRVLGNWQRNLFADVVDERTRLPDGARFADTLIVPGIGFERLIADDPLVPTEGHRLRAEVRGSHGLLAAKTDFLRLHLGASRILSPSDDWRLALRAELGIGIVDGFDELPASQRFFAGGDQSVRGYGFNKLGPTDDEGRSIGGRHLVFGSVEAQRRIQGPWHVAAFIDSGGALARLDDTPEVSAGVGLHFLTPIGRIRVEVAQSLTESRSPRLHISIRPDL